MKNNKQRTLLGWITLTAVALAGCQSADSQLQNLSDGANGAFERAYAAFEGVVQPLVEKLNAVCTPSEELRKKIESAIESGSDPRTVLEQFREEVDAERERMEACLDSHQAEVSEVEQTLKELVSACVLRRNGFDKSSSQRGAVGNSPPRPPPGPKPDPKKLTAKEKAAFLKTLNSEKCINAIQAAKEATP
jgi:hypothetical protein